MVDGRSFEILSQQIHRSPSQIPLHIYSRYHLQCCAISFIENLTHESLSMPQNEFNALMSGTIVGHSVWESALMSCEMMHMLDENSNTIETLGKKCKDTSECLQQLSDEINGFKVRTETKCLARNGPTTSAAIVLPSFHCSFVTDQFNGRPARCVGEDTV